MGDPSALRAAFTAERRWRSAPILGDGDVKGIDGGQVLPRKEVDACADARRRGVDHSHTAGLDFRHHGCAKQAQLLGADL